MENMNNKEESRPHHLVANPLQNQQQNNTTKVNNPYADWTFEELHKECKRRRLL